MYGLKPVPFKSDLRFVVSQPCDLMRRMDGAHGLGPDPGLKAQVRGVPFQGPEGPCSLRVMSLRFLGGRLTRQRIAGGNAVYLAQDSEGVGGLEFLRHRGVGEILEAHRTREAMDGAGSDGRVLGV